MGEMRNTEEKLYITFRSDDDIVQFVDTCCKYDDAIDIKMDKMSTDAKSILGMLLLKLNRPLEIEYGCFDDENNYQQFRAEIMQKFDVKAESLRQNRMMSMA